MSGRTVGLVVVAVLAASPLAAQDPRLAARLAPGTAAEVHAIVAAARSDDLPTEPLIARALEGASKGAAGSRIVAAVRALARDLHATRTALGRTATEAEMTAGAAALRSGVDAAVLSQLRTSRPSAPLTVALGVLADLVARGVPADTASLAVLLLAQAGASDGDFVNLRRNVERDISAGAPPAIAASLRARGRPATLPPALAPPPGMTGAGDRERATMVPRPR